MWPRWLRFLASLWVAFDSRKRQGRDIFWFVVVFALGPLLVPFYLASRPLLANEKRAGNFCWNVLVGFESLLFWLLSLALSASMLENMSIRQSKDIAPVKIAEIKAGTILGTLFLFFLLIVEKVIFTIFRKNFEKKHFIN